RGSSTALAFVASMAKSMTSPDGDSSTIAASATVSDGGAYDVHPARPADAVRTNNHAGAFMPGSVPRPGGAVPHGESVLVQVPGAARVTQRGSSWTSSECISAVSNETWLL